MTARRSLAAALLVALATGCGVPPQGRPEPVPSATGTAPVTDPQDGTEGRQMTVYLVHGTDLVPVQRRTRVPTTEQALELLVEGPTRAEAAAGIRTALAPEVVGVRRNPAEGTATVAVTRGFTGITGGNQMLAVAQVVFTLTELPTVTDVRFTVEDVPVEVPTDAGLSADPVDRHDYRTVAPAERGTSDAPASDAPASSTPSPR